MTRGAPAILLACAVSASPLPAQVTRHVAAGLGATQMRLRSTAAGSGTEALSGVAVGGGGQLSAGLAALEASYLQARLTADTGTASARDLVEGSVRLVVRPTRWLALEGGPHIRAYAAPGGTERWVLWEARARVEGALVSRMVWTDLALWRALAAEANVGQGTRTAQGGEVRLTVRLPQAPVWARLSYRIDQAKTGGGERVETLEGIGVSLGVGGYVPR